MDTLRLDETRLVGRLSRGRVQADDLAKRIDFLVVKVVRRRAA
jgi:hypothetical protein